VTDFSILFEPFTLGTARLSNRIVMAPMTRMKSPGYVPDDAVAAYYRRRAEGGAGLIITEGTTVGHDVSGGFPDVPAFHGEALKGWRKVVEEVHAADGVIFPQLWHLGMQRNAKNTDRPDLPSAGPSGLVKPDMQKAEPMSAAEVDKVAEAFVQAVVDAKAIGFDGVELHGAHGYLIDQFFWDGTNRRTDKWGGDQVERTRFATAIISEARRRVGPDYPIVLRMSQWKAGDYDIQMLPSPQALEAFLTPIVDAGVTAFHCSTRRFWLPEFEGSDLNRAGWAKKLTGLPAISVGSVGLNAEYTAANRMADAEFSMESLERLVTLMQRGDFDLIAVGRAFLPNPDWPNLVRADAFDRIKPYNKDSVDALY